MSAYNPAEIEPKWQQYWFDNQVYKTIEDPSKPKYYVLDMFPYPSGAGLHVGHPLGYIATDIVARYKRAKGYNVLHPMGFDSFGLPAEQYAIDTGQHPAITTEQNIATFKAQLAKIGFCYDWEREVRTSSPDYYRWTQWIFLQLFDSWYDKKADKARPIAELVAEFEANGNLRVQAACDEKTQPFDAQTWKAYSERQKSDVLLCYRLTYLDEAVVNWCAALGSVLANDEVKDGLSERGGHPVERKKMRQWMMRITAYAERLERNLEHLDWSEAMKETQRNWIGRSQGCELHFSLENSPLKITVFTTRIDTIFGVSFLSLAPEYENLASIIAPSQADQVQQYLEKALNRSERDRQSDIKTVSGVFTGSHAIHPLSGAKVPVWVADYVLAGYGTGAVMGVPASDERDFRFAKHFGLPVVPVIDQTKVDERGFVVEPFGEKRGTLINSDFLNGLSVPKAIEAALQEIEKRNIGVRRTNFKLRDAVFGRQRYWGEPIPIYYQDGIPKAVEDLPLVLPEISHYKPTETGEPPLARAQDWKYKGVYDYELTTMPGWAGSSWYFLRYMDPQNQDSFCQKDKSSYWASVDLYVGGTEHATGHLLYARFWTMFLYDRGWIGHEEPFQKLVNQGMIQGRSSLIYKVKNQSKFASLELKDSYDCQELHVDVSMVKNDILDIEKFKQWRPEYAQAEFLMKEDKFVCGYQVEKMSKRWYNVVNPDDVVAQYGADTLRLYEMFLGPLELSKPWSTQGIDGVARFLKKLWRLFYSDKGEFLPQSTPPNDQELRVLHKCIKKITQDYENLSLNTAVSNFMIAVNDLTDLKCNSKAVLEQFLVILAPFAPHIAQELWQALDNEQLILDAPFPQWDEQYTQEDSFQCAIQVNGKLRATLALPIDMPQSEVEAHVLTHETVQKWLEGKTPKKVIVIPKKLVNVVV